MNEFDESLLDRDLAETLGGDAPSAELKDRILARVAAPRTRRPSGRVLALPARRTPWGAYAAAAAALLIAVAAFGWVMTRPAPEAVKDEFRPVSEKVAPTNAAPEPTPQPKPEPRPEAPANEGEPQPQPQPKPEPAPQPEPEQPQPEPDPAPEKPDDTVEQPQPQPQPETPDTHAEPDKRKVAATLLTIGKLKYRENDEASWRLLEGNEIEPGWQLQAKSPVDMRMPNGSRLLFEGELQLGDGNVELLGLRTELYVDALGCEGALVVAREDASIEVANSEAMLEGSGSALEICCFEGGIGEVAAGRYGKLSKRGLSGLRDLKQGERNPRLLKDMPPRRLCFFGLDGETDGIGRANGENAELSLKLDAELASVTGAELRLRFKPSNAGALYVQLQQVAGEKQWGKWLPLAKSGEWLEWSIPLADLQRDDGRGEAPMQPGDTFVNINLFIQDGKQAELELDWLEIVRIRKE